MLAHLVPDIRYGLRSLLSRPGFLIAALVTLALGIGANVAVFSVIHTLLMKPLPYADSERLVDVYNSYRGNDLPIAAVSIPDYLDRRREAPALEESALYTPRSFNLAEAGTQPERLTGSVATPTLFATLGVAAALGRTLVDADATAGDEHVVVLSNALWKNRFGADPAIVGRDVRLNSAPYRVVGVMPEGFFFPDRKTDLWTPFVFTDRQKSDEERGSEYSSMIGRLKPGATIAELDTEMDTIVHRNVERALTLGPRGQRWKAFVESSGFTGAARPLRDVYVGDLRPMLWLLQALVACVLLIACANVANLVLTRLSARQREISVRSALGAGRFRIARQLLVENLMLALAGGALGLALAYAGVALIRKLGLGGPADALAITIDRPVLFFSLALAIVTGIVFGSVPALALSRQRAVVALKESGRGQGAGRATRAMRNGLVVVQMAAAVSLLGVAGLLIRSFVEVEQQSPGFRSDGVLSATIDLPDLRYPDNAARAQFYERLLGEARALSGVESAGLVSNMPFGGVDGSGNYLIDGIDLKAGTFPHAYQQMVDEDFFRTMQIPVLQGRTFAASDTADTGFVAIVDELLAKKYFAGRNPIGQRISVDYDTSDASKTQWLTIVGVVGTIKRDQLSEQTTKETVYVYYKQYPEAAATLALRTTLAPATLVAPLRDALKRIDSEQPLFDIRTMTERIAISLDGRRTPMLLLMLFATVALALAAVGIYGVLAFAVALRTGEIGVRLSLGATPRDILRLVIGDGGKLTAIGLALGLAGAIAIGLAMRTQLYGIAAFDPATLAIVAILIGVTAWIACWLPARRASRVQPTEALRYE
jgi:predicted permease